MDKVKFQKGQTAWNKGIKGLRLSPETEFKKGQFIGEGHPSWKGGVQKFKNDCVYLYAGVSTRIRRPKKVYEKCFGEVPDGFVVYHKDGNRYNDKPENLIALSRAELLKINQERNKFEGGCGEIINANTDYDNEMVVCGKYGNELCPDCQAKKKIQQIAKEVLG